MNQIYIRGNEIATKAYVDSLSLGGDGSALDNYYTKEEVNELIEENSSTGGNADLTNYYTKEEINNIISETNNSIQVEEMPDASEENVGTIVQYVGITNENYTTSNFYQVVEKTIINEDGSETTIYVWEEISTPEINLDGYATKKYVDDTAGAPSFISSRILVFSDNHDFLTYSFVEKDVRVLQQVSDVINKGINMEKLTVPPRDWGILVAANSNSNNNSNMDPGVIHFYTGLTKGTTQVYFRAWKMFLNSGGLRYIYASGSVSGTWDDITGFTATEFKLNADYKYTYDMVSNNSVLLKTNTTAYTPTANYHPATKKYVDDTIATSIAGMSTTSMEVATSLPTENISTSTIYLIKDETASTDSENVYNEYIYVNGAWENIGSTKTEIDLSDYYTKEKIENLFKPTVNEYHIKWPFLGVDRSTNSTTQVINDMQVAINDAYKNNKECFNIAFYSDLYNNSPNFKISGRFYYINGESSAPTLLWNFYDNQVFENGLISSWKLNVYSSWSLNENDEWVPGTFTPMYIAEHSLYQCASSDTVNTAIETAINNIEYPTTDLSNYYTKTEINTMIGDINSLLDAINGEEV